MMPFHHHFSTHIALLSLAIVLIAGCASNIPNVIKQAPAENLSLVRVQKNPDKHLGKPIRWGGTIIAVENQQDITQLTVLAKPLDDYGEPLEGDKSYGRFIAKSSGFLDPAIYAPGRAITIYGKLLKVISKKIDKYAYLYPLVQIEHLYLWQVRDNTNYYPYPYWYDPLYPWWDPYYHPHRHR